MKTPLFAILIAMLFAGCSQPEETQPKVTLGNFSHSECGGFKSESLFADDSQELLVVVHEQQQVYSISHSNVKFNCCLPKGLGVELTLQNDTIYINEKEIEMGLCDCLCPYDLYFELADLKEGTYVLCLMRGSVVRGEFRLGFAKGMMEKIDVSAMN